MMENQTWYKVYRIFRGVRELVASYTDPHDAHEAAQRYNTPQTIIQIEKTTKIEENFV